MNEQMSNAVSTSVDEAYQSIAKPSGVIVIPTDTTYGVICRLDDGSAINRIYEIKGRDRSKPLIILGYNVTSLLQWVEGDMDAIHKLAADFWPGPLTIVAQANSRVPKDILSGGDTVGLRVPDHRATLSLFRKIPGRCVASTSANPSGAGIPKDFDEVTRLMSPHVDYILADCNEPPAGTESTIIDVTKSPPKILRAGALSMETVLSVLNQ
jgi:L-threonylcarbamoyladenylate synthase